MLHARLASFLLVVYDFFERPACINSIRATHDAWAAVETYFVSQHPGHHGAIVFHCDAIYRCCHGGKLGRECGSFHRIDFHDYLVVQRYVLGGSYRFFRAGCTCHRGGRYAEGTFHFAAGAGGCRLVRINMGHGGCAYQWFIAGMVGRR